MGADEGVRVAVALLDDAPRHFQMHTRLVDAAIGLRHDLDVVIRRPGLGLGRRRIERDDAAASYLVKASGVRHLHVVGAPVHAVDDEMYRMKKRAGKKSSPLDDIRPERWTARMSDELLELLWVLESTLAMEPDLVLDKAVAGPCFTAAELPPPKPEERKAPGSVDAKGALLDLMGVEDDDSDDGTDDDEE
jgi:hypothetical protein